ncbi:MAG TPA: urease accessory protein, partial [Janthinobacterium sp.]|nr:urease accessory protein [Janthinobacterium sp.]
MPDCANSLSPTAAERACHARLTLGFADDAGTTRLV